MRLSHLHIIAPAVMVLLCAGQTIAGESKPDAPAAEAPKPSATASAEATDARPQSGPYSPDWEPLREFAARAGAWGVSSSGSPAKVGEYQGLQPFSPFWDLDGISSNGNRTVDLTMTGPEEESTDARLRYYGGPGLSADVNYERFPHRLHEKTYPGWPDGPANATANVPYSRSNLNVGQEYAIRVQEFKANFKGNITDNIKWRLNTFGMYKEGERQANGMAHCYNAAGGAGVVSPPGITTNNAVTRQCHTLSQSQHINWATTEVEPVLEIALADGLRLEYSHTARVFEQHDQMVTNYYRNSVYGEETLGFPDPTNPGSNTNPTFGTAGYAIVPDTTTQIDRLKVHAEIGPDTDAYVLGYVGNTNNELRETNRHFGGVDARVTNRSVEGVTVTGYGKVYSENTEMATQTLNSLYPNLDTFYREPTPPDVSAQNPTGFSYLDLLGTPINRDNIAFGTNARWLPFSQDAGTLRSRFAVTGGYEYSQIRRTFAEDTIYKINTVFHQPDSSTNLFFVGLEERWSTRLTTYIRYKFIDTDYPLYGITPAVNSGAATALDDALNSNLPTLENRVEIGGTWSPDDSFMFNGTVYIENALNHGPYAHFDSTSYPFVLSAWYAPTDRWSLTGGYASFTNWITQDITLTSSRLESGGAGNAPPALTTSPWGYTGKADVFNIGTAYALTRKLLLNGGFEYVRGLNTLTSSAPAGQAYELGSYSVVSVNTYRVSAGVDYLWRPRITTYFRYNFYDYADEATGLESGQAHMFLGGLAAVF